MNLIRVIKLSFLLMFTILMSCYYAKVDRFEMHESELTKAKIEFIKGRYSVAESSFKYALDLHKNDRAEIMYHMGLCRIKLNDFQKAISYLNQALLNSAGLATLGMKIHKALGDVYLEVHDITQALREFQILERTSELLRGSAVRTEEFYYKMGIVYMRAGDFANGKLYLKKLLLDFPNCSHASDARIRLKVQNFSIEVARFSNEKEDKGKIDLVIQRLKKHGMDGSLISDSPVVAVTVGSFHKYQDIQLRLPEIKRLGLNATPLP